MIWTLPTRPSIRRFSPSGEMEPVTEQHVIDTDRDDEVMTIPVYGPFIGVREPGSSMMWLHPEEIVAIEAVAPTRVKYGLVNSHVVVQHGDCRRELRLVSQAEGVRAAKESVLAWVEHRQSSPKAGRRPVRPEAREWLADYPNAVIVPDGLPAGGGPLAPSKEQRPARKVVEMLYHAGAVAVQVESFDLPDRSFELPCQLTHCIVVFPPAPANALHLMHVLNEEVYAAGARLLPDPRSAGFLVYWTGETD